jgi:hypothetical protein
MEGTAHGSVESGDPVEWSAEEVATFLRSLGSVECIQSVGDEVLIHGL